MRPSLLVPLLVPALLLAACNAPGSELPEPQTPPASSDDSSAVDSAAAAQAAREALAVRLGVDARDIAVESVEAREWSDSCLGLGGPAESCLAAITPGFSLTLLHDGTAYRYRTNDSGTAVRAE